MDLGILSLRDAGHDALTRRPSGLKRHLDAQAITAVAIIAAGTDNGKGSVGEIDTDCFVALKSALKFKERELRIPCSQSIGDAIEV